MAFDKGSCMACNQADVLDIPSEGPQPARNSHGPALRAMPYFQTPVIAGASASFSPSVPKANSSSTRRSRL